ncbi:hypothetical protein HELRODRAFT_182017 [Helobdella robusta]|uniref:C-type lectin domain-containing protein n=1 Tax=Helobdella robusta TaxID=6412 RepID=T1FHL6_HELRO|nr:hypothetical protein HELRODRAFT_182017 [Helobdella robusta]ESN91842.1 hypothetical protein HELRODRAFT_182017 [Helobdella robusta]
MSPCSFLQFIMSCFIIYCNFKVESFDQRVYHIASNSNVDVIDVRHNFSTFPSKSDLRTGVLSRNACSILCSLNTLFACKGFEYSKETKECKLVSGFLSGVSTGDNLTRYRLKEVCPQGTTYASSIKSCLILKTTKMTWSDARDACNGMQLNFHPITLDTPEANLALRTLLISLPSTTTSGCQNWADWTVWTSGRTLLSSRPNFFWQPYKDGTIFSIVGYKNWSSGQPDFLYYTGYGCLHPFLDTFEWDDVSCDCMWCVVCQLDLY